MLTVRTLATAFALVSLLVGPLAQAQRVAPSKAPTTQRARDGRWARPKVIKYYKARGRSTNLRVHRVRSSRSGKSTQVVVANKKSGQVRAYNVHNKTGKVSATRTGLTSQKKARVKAHQNLRRERGAKKGTFSGVTKSGLSNSGKSMTFTSKTDRNERAHVKVVGGKLLRTDNGKRAKPRTTRAPKPRVTAAPVNLGADQLK